MFALAKMAGLKADEDGWTILSRIPYSKYSFSCALYGINYKLSGISGYACPLSSGQLKIKVELPEGAKIAGMKIDGIEKPVTLSGRYAELLLQTVSGRKISWELLF
jgi:hypothetical protein